MNHRKPVNLLKMFVVELQSHYIPSAMELIRTVDSLDSTDLRMQRVLCRVLRK